MSDLPPPTFPPPPAGGPPIAPPIAPPGPPTPPDPNATPGRRRRPLVAAGVGVVAVVAVAAIAIVAVVVARSSGDRDDGDTALEFRERWTERVSVLADRDEFESTWIVSSEPDAVVFATAPDRSDDSAALFALDPSTGDELWSLELPVGLSGGLAASRAGDVVLVTSAATDPGDEGQDDPVALLRSAELRALDVRSGEVLWTQEQLEPAPAYVPVGEVVLMGVAEPGEGDELVQRLVARDLTSGDERWDRETSGRVMPVTVRANGIVVLDIGDGAPTYVGLGLDGEERWTLDADVPIAQVGRSDWWPTEEADVVPLIDGDEVVGVGLGSGEQVWDVGLPTVDQLLVAPGTDLAVMCHQAGDSGPITVGLDVVDLSNGEIVWTEEFTGPNPAYLGLVGAAVLTTDDSIGAAGCIGSFGFGAIRGVAARSLEDGRDLWTIPADAETAGFPVDYAERAPWTSPSTSSVSLLLSDGSGDRIVDLSTGEIVVDIPRDDGMPLSGLGRVEGTLIGVQPGADPDDDDSTLVDQLDPERSLPLPPLSRPVGGADGVLYLRSGSRLVAID